jgi:hypothetical protein
MTHFLRGILRQPDALLRVLHHLRADGHSQVEEAVSAVRLVEEESGLLPEQEVVVSKTTSEVTRVQKPGCPEVGICKQL